MITSVNLFSSSTLVYRTTASWGLLVIMLNHGVFINMPRFPYASLDRVRSRRRINRLTCRRLQWHVSTLNIRLLFATYNETGISSMITKKR